MGAILSLSFIANAWVRALLTQPYPASTRTEPGAPRKGHWLGRQQEPHPSPQGLLQVIPLLAFLPIGLPHSRPFHPSGMCLEPPFSSPAPPPVRGVDTRNPGSNMAELNDPTNHHTLPLGTPSSSGFHGSTFSPSSSCLSGSFSLSMVAPEPKKQGIPRLGPPFLLSSSLPLKAHLLFHLGLQL